MQNDSNHLIARQGTTTFQSSNIQTGMSSNDSAFSKQIRGNSGALEDLNSCGQSFFIKGDNLQTSLATSKANLANNRGNAMQRYKEKRKTRRYIC